MLVQQSQQRHHQAACKHLPLLHLHNQAKTAASFTQNYSIFILKTFQDEGDLVPTASHGVTQSWCQVLTFPMSCSRMGAGPCCPPTGSGVS